MKIVGFFDNIEEQVGFRFSGMKTVVIKNEKELEDKVSNLGEDVGILVVSKNIANINRDLFDDLKKNRLPLILEI